MLTCLNVGEDNLDVADMLSHSLVAGRNAAAFLKENFRKSHLEVSVKDDNSPVTRIDRESQSLIITHLKKQFPDIPVIAEEQDRKTNLEAAGRGLYFVVDPLDGTASYILGIPFFCTSIALCQGPQAIAGVVVDPNHGEEFTAVRGKGASLNGTKICVTGRRKIQELYLNVNHAKFPQERFDKINSNVLRKIKRFHKLGSLCLEVAYVAAGRLDGTINNDLSMWDIAAAGLIVEEAGGRWSALDGSRPSFPIFEKLDICASNSKEVHEMLLASIR